jgi:phosphoribulokinase
MSDRQAEELQECVWRLLPGRQSERPRLGGFRDASNTLRHSHPLALSQLLITHYLLNAAVGVHAT